jgi:hypothetical protein
MESQHHVLFPAEIAQLEPVFVLAGARRDIEVRGGAADFKGCHEFSSLERAWDRSANKEF